MEKNPSCLKTNNTFVVTEQLAEMVVGVTESGSYTKHLGYNPHSSITISCCGNRLEAESAQSATCCLQWLKMV